MNVAGTLADLEQKAASGAEFSRADAMRVAECPDLVSVGAIGMAGKKAARGARVTYGRVAIVDRGHVPGERGESGEVRVIGTPSTAAEAMTWVKAAAAFAPEAILTGFSLSELVTLVGGDHMALAELAKNLRAAGLHGVADVPVDLLDDDPAEIVRAVLHGGLLAKRATISTATFDQRPDLIERAASIQRETNAFAAFAPLPGIDPVDAPSTGYDDVKTIVMSRMLAPNIPSVQVDWVLYGPKLAQVAIEYGADDIDGVAAVDVEKLGTRRSPKIDIERQIRSAFAEPAERNGRYELIA